MKAVLGSTLKERDKHNKNPNKNNNFRFKFEFESHAEHRKQLAVVLYIFLVKRLENGVLTFKNCMNLKKSLNELKYITFVK